MYGCAENILDESNLQYSSPTLGTLVCYVNLSDNENEIYGLKMFSVSFPDVNQCRSRNHNQQDCD